MPRADNLAIVPDESMDDEAAAEAELLAAFSSVRAAEKREVACVEIPRYPNVPKRDAEGNLVKDAHGHIILGPLELYFRRLETGTFSELRTNHTEQVPVRRHGRTEYEERIDNDGLSLEAAYTALVPWCRERYFDDQRLWGNEAVGTGQDFLRVRLNLGELSYCLDAVLRLEGLGDERAEQLGKH